MAMYDLVDHLDLDYPDGFGLEPGNRPKLLIVDDDELLLRSLTRILKGRYEVQAESNPYRALVALEDDGPFATIVCDLTMPGVDGIEFLERAYAESPETPRILLTGNATVPASIEAVNRAHITSFLTKPIAPDDLLRQVDQAVAQHAEIVDDSTSGAEILEGSAAALMETLAIANPTAYALTKRVMDLIDRYLDAEDRDDAWELRLAARLCYLGTAALGAELSSRVLHGDNLAVSEDLLVGCVPGFTVEIVGQIPRLARVEDILTRHRSDDIPVAEDPAHLLGIATSLAEFEATSTSRHDAAASLLAVEPAFDTDLVSRMLDLYLPVGESRPDIDLTDGDETRS